MAKNPKNRLISTVAILVMVLALAGCQATFVNSTAKLLKINKVSFELARDGTAALYKQGFVPEADKERLIEIGETYAKAHNQASESLARYVETKNDACADQVEVQVDIIAEALYGFEQIAKPYLLR